MTFVLPRQNRGLRFTGQLRALDAADVAAVDVSVAPTGRGRGNRNSGSANARDAKGDSPLRRLVQGAPRPSRDAARKTPAPGSALKNDIYVQDAPTPYLAARPSVRAEAAAGQVVIEQDASAWLNTDRSLEPVKKPAEVEEEATLALDRDPIAAVLARSRPVAERPAPPASAPEAGAPPRPSPWARENAASPAQSSTVAVALATDRGETAATSKSKDRGGPLPLGFWLVSAVVVGMVSYGFVPEALESAFRFLSQQ